MTQERESPKWPEEGEDVDEVDPFALSEGDRIYIRDATGVQCFLLGPIRDKRVRSAKQEDALGWVNVDLRSIRGSFRVGDPCFICPPNSFIRYTTTFGGISAIRIVRAKKAENPDPTTTPESAACPANP